MEDLHGFWGKKLKNFIPRWSAEKVWLENISSFSDKTVQEKIFKSLIDTKPELIMRYQKKLERNVISPVTGVESDSDDDDGPVPGPSGAPRT